MKAMNWTSILSNNKSNIEIIMSTMKWRINNNNSNELKRKQKANEAW
jgi:hypothetical protein